MKLSILMVIVDVPLHSGRPHFFLRDAIESVRNGGHQNFELLIASDGPLPKAKEMIDGIGDERIRFVEMPRQHQWGHDHRNRLIGMATGDLIGFLDHDDAIAENALFKVASYAEKFPGRPLLLSIQMPAIVGGYVMRPALRFGSLAGSMLYAPRDLLAPLSSANGYSGDYDCLVQTITNAKEAGRPAEFLNDIGNMSRPWFGPMVAAAGYKMIRTCVWM